MPTLLHKSPRLLLLLIAPIFLFSTFPRAVADDRPPNVVTMFLDDSGWGDFSPFFSEGEAQYPTPHIQQLADEGSVFTQFYVPQAICSASRSALLSGCYPCRTKVFGAHGPNGRGLEPSFATLAEVLKTEGYATGIFGKWHCGDQPETRPMARGFDEVSGIMYSNDMWKYHPGNPEHWGKHPLKYYEDGEVKIADVEKEDQVHFTTWFAEEAVEFIGDHKDEPFFLYIPHPQPHVPLFVSDKFDGKSGKGLYADVMMEIDWSMGQITQALKNHGLEENTLVMFTSDNGPWVSYGDHAGTTPYREAKGTSFDGGVRSACIVKFPKAVPAGKRSDAAWGRIDVLPTVAKLAGAALPANEVDGMDVWDVVCGKEGATNPHEYYVFSNGREMQCIMTGDGTWKLHVPHGYRSLGTAGKGGDPGRYKNLKIGYALFNLDADPNESTNVIEDHPKVATKLKEIAMMHRERFYGKK